MALNLTSTQDPTASQVLNRWASQTETAISALQSQANQTQQTVATTPTPTPAQAIPSDPTGVSVSQAGYIVDGVLFSEITCTYTAPNPLGTFAAVFCVVSGYNANTSLVKVAENKFSGVGGGAQSFNVTLNKTGETITVYFVAANSDNASRTDWASAPSVGGIVLNGNATAPNPPIGLVATQQTLGVTLAWTENSELNLQGYNIYRNTSNSFSGSVKIGMTPTTRVGTPSYLDKTGTLATTYYYWITAVNTAKLESTASGVASNNPAAVVSDAITNGATTLIPTQIQINNAIDGAGNLLLKNIGQSAQTGTNTITTSTTPVIIDSMVSQTLTTKGNKVLVILQGSFCIEAGQPSVGEVYIYRDGSAITNGEVSFLGSSADILVFSMQSLSWIDVVAAGSHTYAGYWSVNSGGTIRVDYCTLQAVELG